MLYEGTNDGNEHPVESDTDGSQSETTDEDRSEGDHNYLDEPVCICDVSSSTIKSAVD